MEILETELKENLRGAAEPLTKEQGNKKQWEQELDGEATLNKFEKDGRSFKVIAAEHFSMQADRFLQEDISREITDPREWLFLVEGKDSGIYECEIARKIAEEKRILIEDPIFNPYQAQIIELYLTSNRGTNIPREILIGQLAANLANARGASDLEEVATILGVENSQILHSYLHYAVKEKEKDPVKYSTISKQLFNDLLEISNAVSTQVLNYFLQQNPTRTNIVLYLGKAHERIVTMDISQIPDNLKFNYEQIRDLLDKREISLDKRKRARISQIFRVYGNKLSGAKESLFTLEPAANIEEQKTRQESSRKKRVAEVLTTSGIPENLKTLIAKWSDNLFGLEHVRRRGYKEYLNSDNSLHQLWGASTLLVEKVYLAESENRELTSGEISEIKEAFLKAASSRRKDAIQHMSQGDEIEELANGVNYLVDIVKRLKIEE